MMEEDQALSKLWEYFWKFRQSDLEEADEWGFCSRKQFDAFMIEVCNMIASDEEEKEE